MTQIENTSESPFSDAHRGGCPEVSPSGRLLTASEAGVVSSPSRATPLNPMYGPEETVPGMACSYGSLAYSYAAPPDEAAQRPRYAACHNPVETPQERFHCGCGGDYCAVHAEPAAHDCENVITSA